MEKLRLGIVDVEGLTLEIVALDGVGVGDDGGEGADEPHRLQQQVFDGGVVGIRVIGVEREDAAGQLVHDVLAGVVHDHALGEALGELAGLIHDVLEVIQLGPGGEIPHEQQIRDLLIAERSRFPVGAHDVIQVDAAVVQPAGRGDALAILNEVALHAADLRHADEHAGAVAVAQATLHVAAVILLAYGVFLTERPAERAGICLESVVVLFDHCCAFPF